MSRWRAALRPLFVVLAVASCLAGVSSTSAHAASKTFRLTHLVTVATVKADRSMHVEEAITYVFDGGPFNFGIRSFNPLDRVRIEHFTAKDERGQALETIAPADSVSGEWDWRLGGVSDTTITYRLSYDVPAAVYLGPDVGEL